MNKIIILLLLFFSSCVKQNDYQKINDFLVAKNDALQLSTYKQLIVVNTLGDCLNCNNSFSVQMGSYLQEDSTLFLISSSGSKIDISSYIDSKATNVVFDFREEFRELNLISHSSIIKFKENAIDTIIEFDAKNIGSCTFFIED